MIGIYCRSACKLGFIACIKNFYSLKKEMSMPNNEDGNDGLQSLPKFYCISSDLLEIINVTILLKVI